MFIPNITIFSNVNTLFRLVNQLFDSRTEP